MTTDDARRQGGRRWAHRTVYWLAVMAVSVVLVALLLQVIHSLDGATLGT